MERKAYLIILEYKKYNCTSEKTRTPVAISTARFNLLMSFSNKETSKGNRQDEPGASCNARK